jgi:hypothetical protein
MSHVQQTIDDSEQKIAALTDVVEKLRWFQREFPYSAAAVAPAEPSKISEPKTAPKNDRQTDRQTEQSRGRRPRGASLTLTASRTVC